jgi:hypothetical protein
MYQSGDREVEISSLQTDLWAEEKSTHRQDNIHYEPGYIT